MTDDRWHLDELDLPAYLARTGLAARRPSIEALDELHTAHVRTFPFENIDVLLRQHPGVQLGAVAEKFVERGRGGYCFEHGTLFAAVLERLGYDVERHLGRVGDPGTAGRTHMTVVVTIEGRRYLCDPGFGMSLLRPILLEHGAQDDRDGWAYRVQRIDEGGAGAAWRLERFRDEEWQRMHTTDEVPVRPVDLVMGHHFTSTFPGSHFTQRLILARHGDNRHTTVSPEGLTTRVPGRPTTRTDVAAEDLPALLREHGVTLSEEEVQRLVALWPGMLDAA
ncbi:arylamine N-acetyltransferase family protein [Luteipulveratus flavus]|uniref:Arylamine N-acetyltransferase n=1 Tax=Luteipulveratus flavus TaxID=3031728 RepID=A0ABT6CB44_9MICO|nr:arylamine N-acetyltransferase [Luteipulveratus sp. YIM 133296]MDF8266118.1 arylamine N-acetyltransferase [Luteipulveratus sp. YIM 133296]